MRSKVRAMDFELRIEWMSRPDLFPVQRVSDEKRAVIGGHAPAITVEMVVQRDQPLCR